mgnify:CR=1 FL=1
MQNLGRFREMKLNKLIFFCLFGMFLSVSTAGYVAEPAAAAKQIVPCQVFLETDRDGEIRPWIHCDFFPQRKYSFGYSNPLNLTG